MIDEEKLRAAFAELKARVDYLEQASGLFASEEEMAGERGNPSVKFSPRSWKGPDFTGKRYSECSPDFLEALAEALTWSADHPKEGREKYAMYDRVDARRCRSWARRLRAGGWTPPPAPDGPARGARRTVERPARPVRERPARPQRGAAPPPVDQASAEPTREATRAPEPAPNPPADVGYVTDRGAERPFGATPANAVAGRTAAHDADGVIEKGAEGSFLDEDGDADLFDEDLVAEERAPS